MSSAAATPQDAPHGGEHPGDGPENAGSASAASEGLGEGAVLRLKIGYNPNSSSIGTIVFAMPAAIAALTVAFGTAAAILCGALLRAGTDRRTHRGGSDAARAPTPASEAPRRDAPAAPSPVEARKP